MIKRLDALELKAAAEKARQEADGPEAGQGWTGYLGLMFGLAEAGLLDYSGNVPAVVSGYMPFDVEYVLVRPQGEPWQRYRFSAGVFSEEEAAAWSAILANGLWQRLKPPVFIEGTYRGNLRAGWDILNDACNPPGAGALNEAVEHHHEYGWKTDAFSWHRPFTAAWGKVEADDPRLIAAAMNFLFHSYEGGKWVANRSYTLHEGIERGAPVDLAQFDR
jgi:hypothetical protein